MIKGHSIALALLTKSGLFRFDILACVGPIRCNNWTHLLQKLLLHCHFPRALQCVRIWFWILLIKCLSKISNSWLVWFQLRWCSILSWRPLCLLFNFIKFHFFNHPLNILLRGDISLHLRILILYKLIWRIWFYIFLILTTFLLIICCIFKLHHMISFLFHQ